MADLAILLVCDSIESVLPVLRAYCAGSDPSQMEVVLAVVGGVQLDARVLRPLGFASIRMIDGGDGVIGVAEARAIRAATAAYVVIAQAHGMPRPGTGAALLAACATGEWTIIGPAVAEGAPRNLWSRAYNRIGYGRWMHNPAGGPSSNVPAHNSAYDRLALLSLGGQLDGLLDAGWALVVALLSRGGRAYLEPSACVEIPGPESPGAFAAKLFALGRRAAGQRRAGWPRWRTLAYAAASPLIPIVRAFRIAIDDRRHGQRAWGLWPAVLAGLVISAVGEAWGFLFGPGADARLTPPRRRVECA